MELELQVLSLLSEGVSDNRWNDKESQYRIYLSIESVKWEWVGTSSKSKLVKRFWSNQESFIFFFNRNGAYS